MDEKEKKILMVHTMLMLEENGIHSTDGFAQDQLATIIVKIIDYDQKNDRFLEKLSKEIEHI